MDGDIRQALETDRTIDITTTGRKSGEARRIEIWFHNLDGRIYITGMPGKRSWYANLLANPELTFHLKESVAADVPATAIPVTDRGERRRVLGAITERLSIRGDLERWVNRSPLVEVRLDGSRAST